MKGTVGILLVSALYSVSLAAPRHPGQLPGHRPFTAREKIGIRLGNDFERDPLLLGAQFWFPLGSCCHLVPSFDMMLREKISDEERWQFNGDLVFHPRPLQLFYIGGGLAVFHSPDQNPSNRTRYGGNALLGLTLGRRSPISFFIQGRWSYLRHFCFSLMAGMNLVLQ